MEEKLVIKTNDNHVIHGTFNYRKKKPDNLIIFVHGLASHRNNHIFFNAAKFFPKHGLATFRFNLYGWRKKQRKLRDSTIALHASDVTRVINYWKRKKFSNIFLVGHSLGCPTILLSDVAKVKGIVLWDPSVGFREKKATILRYDRRIDSFIINWNTDILLGKKMYHDLVHFPTCRKLMQNVHRPIKIICAGEGILVKAGREYFKYAHEPKEFAVIKNATHNFDEEGTEEELFEETLKWIV